MPQTPYCHSLSNTGFLGDVMQVVNRNDETDTTADGRK
jgi:hypothetical protein